MNFLDVPENKITVIHHGAFNELPYPKERRFDFQYLLFVGERGRYKNFNPMLIEIAEFLKKHNIKLVCTHYGFDKKEQALIKSLGLQDYVVHCFCNDIELRNLYSNALAFIFPSLYEGFGIPILEAYQCNCPVFLNNKSVFPEIAQDAAIFFELDENKRNLSEKLEMFLNFTDAEKHELLEKQLKRLADFSWKKSAEKLNEVYLSLLK
jgi:glycosyltransferase involved in cell wall biosynthesis